VDIKRRTFLKFTLMTSALLALGTSLLKPKPALAAWPEDAFNSNSLESALRGLNIETLIESDDIKIQAPSTVENGAIVPISVQSNIENVNEIIILVEKNQQPLVGSYQIATNVETYVSTRIKMEKTSNVLALIQADDKTYIAKQNIIVVHSGCDS